MPSMYSQFKQKPEPPFTPSVLVPDGDSASRTRLQETFIQTKQELSQVSLGKVVAIEATRFQGSGMDIRPTRSAAAMLGAASASPAAVDPASVV